jgi:hypothetical protein
LDGCPFSRCEKKEDKIEASFEEDEANRDFVLFVHGEAKRKNVEIPEKEK